MIYYHEMYEKGIIYVKDLVFEGNIISHQMYCQLFNSNIPIMKFNQLIAAIPNKWKKAAAQDPEAEHAHEYQILIEKEKWSSSIYSRLNETDDSLQKVVNIWAKKGINMQMNEMQEAFTQINRVTRIPKYRAFQYRLLQNAILLNDRLIYCKVSDTNLCCQCNLVKENTIHFFYECTCTQKIWGEIKIYLKRKYEVSINPTKSAILFNCIDTVNLLSFVNLVAMVMKQMQYAFKCRNKQIKTQHVIDEIEFIHELEKNQSKTVKAIKLYNRKWPDNIPTITDQQESEFGNEYILQNIHHDQ